MVHYPAAKYRGTVNKTCWQRVRPKPTKEKNIQTLAKLWGGPDEKGIEWLDLSQWLSSCSSSLWLLVLKKSAHHGEKWVAAAFPWNLSGRPRHKHSWVSGWLVSFCVELFDIPISNSWDPVSIKQLQLPALLGSEQGFPSVRLWAWGFSLRIFGRADLLISWSPEEPAWVYQRRVYSCPLMLSNLASRTRPGSEAAKTPWSAHRILCRCLVALLKRHDFSLRKFDIHFSCHKHQRSAPVHSQQFEDV